MGTRKKELGTDAVGITNELIDTMPVHDEFGDAADVIEVMAGLWWNAHHFDHDELLRRFMAQGVEAHKLIYGDDNDRCA